MKKIRKNIFTLIATVSLSLATAVGVGYQTLDKELFTASAATGYTPTNGYDYRIDGDLDGSPDSFEAWINLPINSTGGTIAGNAHVDYSQSSSYAYDTTNWEISTGGLFRIDWNDGAVSHVFDGTKDLRDGAWHHVACVRTNTAFTYYLDGEVAGTYTVNTTPLYSQTPFIIGADQTTWSGRKTPLNGYIRQVTIYEGAITQAQVKADMGTASAPNDVITQQDCVSSGAKLLGNWYLHLDGTNWVYNTVKNTVVGGPNAILSTHETYVAGSLPDASTYDYSFAVIPDIQQMTRYVPERLHTQMKWIADNAASNKIKFAMQLGDLADIGYIEWEYMNASKAMAQLNNKVPYCFVPGNHDYTNLLDHSRDTEFLNKWFPVDTPSAAYTGYYANATTDSATITNNPGGRWDNDHVRYFYNWKTDVSEYNKPTGMSDLPGFGGVYEEGESANSYYVFETGVAGVEYLVLNLEYQPRKAVLRWASRVIDKYPHHRVIINSHNIINPDGDFNQSYSRYHGDTTPAQGVYDYLISQHSNIFLSFSGHECFDDILINEQTGVNGNTVRSMLVDTQVAWDPNETATIASTSAYSNRTSTTVFNNKQDMFAMVYVNESTKMMTVRFFSPENMNRGENAFWNIQNQFSFSFADDKNPAIGGVKTDVEGTVKNVVDGEIAGATVQIKGTSRYATTDANGNFSFKDVVTDSAITLVVTKVGYQESETSVELSSLTPNGVTTLSSVNLSHDYANTGVFATKYANVTAEVGRKLDGVEFRLTGKKAMQGVVEIYFDTKTSADHRDDETSMWRFELSGADYAWVGGAYNTTSPSTSTVSAGIRYDVIKNDSSGYQATFFIPYTAVGLDPTEVFGFSFGQKLPSDWDGWSYNGYYIDPAHPKEFVRLSEKNVLFNSQLNSAEGITLSGTVYKADGQTAASGVLVYVEGGDAFVKTDANGFWSMQVAKPTADMTISYADGKGLYAVSKVEKTWFSTHDTYSENTTLEKIEYLALGGTVAGKGASWTPYAARTETGLELKFVGANAFNGFMEVFLDTGKSSVSRITGDYFFILNANGSMTVRKYNDSAETTDIAASYLPYNLTYNNVTENGKPVVYFSVPYKYFNIDKTATVGVSAGQNNGTTWDGWDNVSYVGYNASGYVAPEIPYDYIRVGYDGANTAVFWEITNTPVVQVTNDAMGSTSSSNGIVWNVYASRDNTKTVFKFEGTKDAFNGTVNLWVDSGASTSSQGTGDYRFDMTDGLYVCSFETGSAVTVSDETKLSYVTYKKLTVNGKVTLYLIVENAFFGISSTANIGLSCGHTDTSGYKGWSTDDFANTANSSNYVAPEIPTDYIRISADNTVYYAQSN